MFKIDLKRAPHRWMICSLLVGSLHKVDPIFPSGHKPSCISHPVARQRINIYDEQYVSVVAFIIPHVWLQTNSYCVPLIVNLSNVKVMNIK